MGFSKMMELLQIKNKGKIVFCNAGNFYIAVGKDAILLNEILDFKLSCLKQEICKIGFPIQSLEKYTDLIQEKGYSYIVYYFNQEKEELEVLLDYNGKIKNNIQAQKLNCYTCKHSTKVYKKPDKYILALSKLYHKEDLEEQAKETERKEIGEKEKWFKKKKKKTN